ncbi:hypothetical protein pb186bvf_018783 [Paramecium bursaria]
MILNTHSSRCKYKQFILIDVQYFFFLNVTLVSNSKGIQDQNNSSQQKEQYYYLNMTISSEEKLQKFIQTIRKLSYGLLLKFMTQIKSRYQAFQEIHQLIDVYSAFFT